MNVEGNVRGRETANKTSRLRKFEVEDVEQPWESLRQLLYLRLTMKVPLLEMTNQYVVDLVDVMSQLLPIQKQITIRHTRQTRREFQPAHNHRTHTRLPQV